MYKFTLFLSLSFTTNIQSLTRTHLSLNIRNKANAHTITSSLFFCSMQETPQAMHITLIAPHYTGEKKNRTQMKTWMKQITTTTKKWKKKNKWYGIHWISFQMWTTIAMTTTTTTTTWQFHCINFNFYSIYIVSTLKFPSFVANADSFVWSATQSKM